MCLYLYFYVEGCTRSVCLQLPVIDTSLNAPTSVLRLLYNNIHRTVVIEGSLLGLVEIPQSFDYEQHLLLGVGRPSLGILVSLAHFHFQGELSFVEQMVLEVILLPAIS